MLGSTLYRADLLRVLSAGEGTIPAEVAARLCGFEYEKLEPGEKPPLTLTHSTEPPPVVEPPVESPPTSEAPRFRFWRAESLAVEPEESHRRRHETPPNIARAQPLTNADFCFSGSPSPGRPLLPWFRLWPFVRMALARPAFTRRPDVPRVVRHLAEGRSVRRLPCVQRSGWHPRARVLLDRREGLAPFWDDYDFLVRRLKAVRGTLGLRIESVPTLDLHDPTPDDCCQAGLESPPESWRALVRGSESTAVLVLSDLNQFQSELLQAPWLGLGRQFRRRGVRPWVLCPCPRDRWTPALAHLWQLAAWDRGLRLPTAGRGQRAEPPASADLPDALHQRREQADQLAVRVSPAIRVERGLLRDIRLLLSHSEADAGTEYDLWQSVSGSTLGFTFPATQLRKLRIAFSALPLEDQAAVIRLLQIHHAYCANVFGHLEILALRDVLKPDRFKDLIREGVLTVDALDRANEFIRRYVAALHRTPDALASGTDVFAARDLDRLQAHARHGPELQALWMLSRREDGSPLPEWVKPDQLAWLDPLTQPDTRHEIGWRRGLNARDGHLLSAMHSRSAIYNATVERTAGKVTHRLNWSAQEILEADRLAEAHRVTLQSDREKVELAQFTRPAWARRLWQDRFGLAAEFAVSGVPFVLRWIPPGRFLMGSPEEEPGRWTKDNREGPQHEVTISRGFWLGETPVTQGQWRAVVESTQRDQPRSRLLTETRAPLNPSPSYFRGPPELPVEQVTWDDCRNFCEHFSDLLRDGPGFGLPTEAQWEYACRAGTSTALYTGPLTILGENHGPELDPIAWYGGNSGRELEVENPFDSSGWPEKQYLDSSAGTHRVKLKRPNAWGLYDTLGNVDEWCADAWGDYSAESQIDPFRDGPEDAPRVVRGGSWGTLARSCRAAFRLVGLPGCRIRGQGFRLAAGLELQAAEPKGRRGGAGAEGRSPKGPSTAKRSR
jgi:formylglycine-generating enzyme required for sulfatase activity